MVGSGAHGEGKEGALGEEEGEPCGIPECITRRDLSDEEDGKREEGWMLEGVL